MEQRQALHMMCGVLKLVYTYKEKRISFLYLIEGEAKIETLVYPLVNVYI